MHSSFFFVELLDRLAARTPSSNGCQSRRVVEAEGKYACEEREYSGAERGWLD